MKRMTLVILTAVVVVILFLLLPVRSFAGGNVQPLEKAERPVWTVGDKWIIQATITGGPEGEKKSLMERTVIGSDDNGYLVAVDTEGKKTTVYHNKDTNFVWSKDESGNITEADAPEVPILKWPLVPGKIWSGTYFFQDNKLSTSGNFVMEGKVIGAETLITADNQEIATFKVVTKIFNQKFGKFFGSRESWYDPSMGYIRKRVQQFNNGKVSTQEVISFTRGSGAIK